MGDSHFKSNVIGKDGTETIRGFATISASTLIGSTSITGAAAGGFATLTATTLAVSGEVTLSDNLTIAAAKYIQLGSYVYITSGALDTAASVAEAIASDINASCAGSLYLGTDGQHWIMTDDTTAATVVT